MIERFAFSLADALDLLSPVGLEHIQVHCANLAVLGCFHHLARVLLNRLEGGLFVCGGSGCCSPEPRPDNSLVSVPRNLVLVLVLRSRELACWDLLWALCMVGRE